MGYMRHHTIVVTSWKKEHLRIAHAEAESRFGDTCSEIIESPINGYLSFFIAPDGSKEGWYESNKGDEHRDQFIKWILATKEQRKHGDGFYVDWVEVFYGDDERLAKITRHSGQHIGDED